MVIRDRSVGSIAFDVLAYSLLLLAGLACLLPMIHMVAVSFSDRAATLAHAVGLWPVNFNLANYERVWNSLQFKRSFMISVLRVIGGTSISTLVTILAAYPLSVRQSFLGQKVFKWLLIISMFFSGGLIPWYLALKSYGLINQLWGLILPGAVSAWNIILALNYFRGLPVELSEAAEIDGASHWDILFRITLPLSTPMIATVTLFSAVGHWNAWFDGLIVMSQIKNYPLQTYLQTLMVGTNSLIGDAMAGDNVKWKFISDRSIRGAEIVIAVLPILLVYPLVQRYFVHGLVIGSIKG